MTDELQLLADKAYEADNQPAPRFAVCGGPDADGNGCEYCPAVGTGAIESSDHDA